MYYQLQVSLDLAFDELLVNKVVEDLTQYTVDKNLEEFGVYYWRVKGIDPQTGAKSAWSTPCAFRVKGKDVVIGHDINLPIAEQSYVIYGSEYFGLEHKFIRSYDTECVIPDAVIGSTACGTIPTSGVAQVDYNYCDGVCVSSWDGTKYDIQFIYTEDDYIIETEDGVKLILEF